MPLFTGVGDRIRARLIALGYQQPNGNPDVRKFCRERDYDDTLFYFWLRDLNTPMKERARLCGDLGISESELLFGAVPKAPPASGRPRKRKLKKLLWLALTLGAVAGPSPSAAAQAQTLPLDEEPYLVRLLGSWRRFRNQAGHVEHGMAFAS
jgi:hypothetical protein